MFLGDAQSGLEGGPRNANDTYGLGPELEHNLEMALCGEMMIKSRKGVPGLKRTPGVARPDGMYHSELLWDYGAGYWERWEAAKNAEVEAAEAGSVVGDGEEAGTPVDSPSSEIIVQSDELHVHVHESLEHVHSTPSHSSP